MPDAAITLPQCVILPAETLLTVLRYVEREHDRLSTWQQLGAHASMAQDATDLAVAITIGARTLTHGTGGSTITLKTEVAATLHYFARRELGRLCALNAWFPDADLDQQVAELQQVLRAIPVTLRRETASPALPVVAIDPAHRITGEACHG